MKDQCDPDIYCVQDERADNEHGPNLLNFESAVLAEFVMKGSGDVLERDYLFLGKSSYGDLKDRDAAVTDERKTDYEISKRDLEIDSVEGDEEAQSA